MENYDLNIAQTFSALYDATHVRIYRYLYGLIGGPAEEAQDLTAQTYVRAWSARHTFKGNQDDALHWLFKIAKHQAFDTFRKFKNHNSLEPLENYDLRTSEPDLESQVIDHQQSVLLWNSLQHLPRQPREMLVLRYMLDWSVKDIAQFMGKKETAVSMAIHRALKQIKNHDAFTHIDVPTRSGFYESKEN